MITRNRNAGSMLLAAALMTAGLSTAGFTGFGPPSTGKVRRLRSYPRSKYMPHSGVKEQAKHLARRAAGIVECPLYEEAPVLAMAT